MVVLPASRPALCSAATGLIWGGCTCGGIEPCQPRVWEVLGRSTNIRKNPSSSHQVLMAYIALQCGLRNMIIVLGVFWDGKARGTCIALWIPRTGEMYMNPREGYHQGHTAVSLEPFSI